jgi:hypothetical protein
LFIAGMSAGPLALACYIAGLATAVFRRSFRASAICHAGGGLLFCSFLWYVHFLGGALGHKIGTFVPTPWTHFLAPWPVAVTSAFIFISLTVRAMRGRKDSGIQA